MATQTAVATRSKVEGLPSAPLARINELQATMESLAGKVNIVCPVSSVDSVLPMHAISLRAVVISSEVNNAGAGAEVYKGKFCEQNERALGKVALDKIAAAAGLQTIGRRRLDDRSDPYYCEIEITQGLRDFDGTWRQVTKTKAIDLRDGSPAANSFKNSPAALAQQRSVIQELAETKAGLRCMRTLLSIRQKYTVDELKRPFVVPKLIPALDPNDPDQKQALIGMAVGQSNGLYGPTARALPAASETVREVKDVTPAPEGKGTPPPPVGATPPDPEDDDEPEAPELEAYDFETPAEQAALIVCLCPCGHQAEVDELTARTSKEHIQTIRCAKCYPGPSFELDLHKDMRGSLEIPRYPGLKASDIADRRAAAAKKTK